LSLVKRGFLELWRVTLSRPGARRPRPGAFGPVGDPGGHATRRPPSS